MSVREWASTALGRAAALGSLPSDALRGAAAQVGARPLLSPDHDSVLYLGRDVCGARALALGAHSTRLPGGVAGRAHVFRQDEALWRLSREPGRNVPRSPLPPPVEPGGIRGIGCRRALGVRRAPRRARLLRAPPGDRLVPGLPRPGRLLRGRRRRSSGALGGFRPRLLWRSSR